MDEMNATKEEFGCAICWPAAADKAWEAVLSLAIDAELVDESHFAVMIRACPECRQRFVSVFTETVDWVDSEDPQFWKVLPVTEQEVEQLSRARTDMTSALNALAPRRRSLCHDFPKGESPKEYWSSGILVRPHD